MSKNWRDNVDAKRVLTFTRSHNDPFDDYDLPTNLYAEEEEDIVITTCSGCGAYGGVFGPHFGCQYDGEYM